MHPHLGWRSRGYVPHFDAPGELQHIVFRLADSLPTKLVAELQNTPAKDRLSAAEAELDAGVGSRRLADPRIAALVSNALRHFDGRRYHLHAWCVMHTHVHVLALQAEGWPLGGVVHSWKSFTAHAANAQLNRSGPFWARDYFDRGMRSERQAEHAAAYIEANPVARACAPRPKTGPGAAPLAGETPADRNGGDPARPHPPSLVRRCPAGSCVLGLSPKAIRFPAWAAPCSRHPWSLTPLTSHAAPAPSSRIA